MQNTTQWALPLRPRQPAAASFARHLGRHPRHPVPPLRHPHQQTTRRLRPRRPLRRHRHHITRLSGDWTSSDTRQVVDYSRASPCAGASSERAAQFTRSPHAVAKQTEVRSYDSGTACHERHRTRLVGHGADRLQGIRHRTAAEPIGSPRGGARTGRDPIADFDFAGILGSTISDTATSPCPGRRPATYRRRTQNPEPGRSPQPSR